MIPISTSSTSVFVNLCWRRSRIKRSLEHLASELGEAKATALMPSSKVLFVLDAFGEPISVAGTTISIYREGLEIEEDEIIPPRSISFYLCRWGRTAYPVF